ncbi:hypothetical protein NEHOM01_1137 [Nematocida homosporus]|uniref:uncharacterized protein n=1 Tax=Nematocida homosporus TaxID=1912981 RepID=UPI00221E67D8|nr:uncharacterized protein NEHOM01_1137 [Nematocida homosporus]KAI5185887.1 hypothetical protein NEHOM01_1137 [Nematocida homosporus]
MNFFNVQIDPVLVRIVEGWGKGMSVYWSLLHDLNFGYLIYLKGDEPCSHKPGLVNVHPSSWAVPICFGGPATGRYVPLWGEIEVNEKRWEIRVLDIIGQFATLSEFLVWRDFLLWGSQEGNLLNLSVSFVGGDPLHKLSIYDGYFDFEKWEHGVELNNTDMLEANRSLVDLAYLSDQSVKSIPIRDASHCAKREYYNLQTYLKSIWWHPGREKITAEAGDKEIFHVVVFDKFYKYTGRKLSSAGECRSMESIDCLCKAFTIEDGFVDYVYASRPEDYLKQRRKLLTLLTKNFPLLEKYYELYLRRFPSLAERIDNFYPFMTRDRQLLDELGKFMPEENSIAFKMLIMAVSEHQMIRYISDRAGIRFFIRSSAPSNWHALDKHNGLYIIQLDQAYTVHFRPQTAADLPAILFELHKNLLQRNNAISTCLTPPFKYMVQMHILAKHILVFDYNQETACLPSDYSIPAMKTTIGRILQIGENHNETECNPTQTYFSCFALSLFLMSYLSYSPRTLLLFAQKWATYNKTDTNALRIVLTHLRRLAPACQDHFPAHQVNSYVKQVWGNLPLTQKFPNYFKAKHTSLVENLTKEKSQFPSVLTFLSATLVIATEHFWPRDKIWDRAFMCRPDITHIVPWFRIVIRLIPFDVITLYVLKLHLFTRDAYYAATQIRHPKVDEYRQIYNQAISTIIEKYDPENTPGPTVENPNAPPITFDQYNSLTNSLKAALAQPPIRVSIGFLAFSLLNEYLLFLLLYEYLKKVFVVGNSARALRPCLSFYANNFNVFLLTLTTGQHIFYTVHRNAILDSLLRLKSCCLSLFYYHEESKETTGTSMFSPKDIAILLKALHFTELVRFAKEVPIPPYAQYPPFDPSQPIDLVKLESEQNTHEATVFLFRVLRYYHPHVFGFQEL